MGYIRSHIVSKFFVDLNKEIIMTKYLIPILFVGMVMGQSSQYITAKKLLSKNDKLYELSSESMILSDVLVKTANKNADLNFEVLQQYYDYNDDFNDLYDNITQLSYYVKFYDIIADCEGENVFTDKLLGIRIEDIEDAVKFEQENVWKATHTKDSGVLMWYNNYLEYISELKLIL
jgi:hypothetical protein